MSGTPELRALTSGGEVYDDPSEGALFMFLEDLRDDGDHLIVERVADEQGQTYVQAVRSAAGYVVERRTGSPESHEHAATSDMRMVHGDLTTWAFGLDRTETLGWEPGFGI